MSNVDLANGERESESSSENVDGVPREELVDPRVQIELERLNTATDLINKFEIELDEARSNFRLLLSESSLRVNQLAKKLGSCVEKARPYYEARMHAKQLQTQTQRAALRYERASSAHAAAKEMVYLAEEGLKKEGRCFDPAWQEMLNHATLRVNEAESERVLSQHAHQKTSLAYNEAEKVVQQLHQELKKSIIKSSLSTRRSLLQLNNLANQHQLQLLPYFEMKAKFNQLLEEQRKKVHHLEENVLKVKMSYADALHNLEEISDEIHQKRKRQENQIVNERSEDVSAASPNYTWDGLKIPYHKFKSNSVSCEDVYLDNLNSEEMYMSLPDKLKVPSSIVTTTCKANNTQDKWMSNLNTDVMFMSLPPKFLNSGLIAACCLGNSAQTRLSKSSSQESLTREEKEKTECENYSSEFAICSDKVPNGTATESHFAVHDDSHFIKNQFKHLDISNDKHQFNVNKSEIKDRSPERDETHDHKYLAADFNILRVQREEISDSESLASNDTADTLDDNQIECLLLDKVLPQDVEEGNPENSFNNYKSNEKFLV
ncbi:SH3 domain-binding protein 5-like isoform X2 [Stegodyphus dumicola]|uniref:SH3 domain-binding protein 5-like isoform X2 n=1 Tax=Stegodyphus dumicola TaxID=202533 RepID=UPI0015AC8525|nr:SH3 domain-binding protein 5-like isoform X2 [Stegodyphus dumicola]